MTIEAQIRRSVVEPLFADGPLISTRLQPGVSARTMVETVSTVSSRRARLHRTPAKPLKRLGSLSRHTTGLKPGANESATNRNSTARPCRRLAVAVRDVQHA